MYQSWGGFVAEQVVLTNTVIFWSHQVCQGHRDPWTGAEKVDLEQQ